MRESELIPLIRPSERNSSSSFKATRYSTTYLRERFGLLAESSWHGGDCTNFSTGPISIFNMRLYYLSSSIGPAKEDFPDFFCRARQSRP